MHIGTQLIILPNRCVFNVYVEYTANTVCQLACIILWGYTFFVFLRDINVWKTLLDLGKFNTVAPIGNIISVTVTHIIIINQQSHQNHSEHVVLLSLWLWTVQ